MDSEKINPYATPAVIRESSAGAIPRFTGKYGPYRDNRRLSAWLTGLLLFITALHLRAGVGEIAHLKESTAGTVAWPLPFNRALNYAGALSGIACFALFGTWIVRSGKNAWLFAEASRLPNRLDFKVKQFALQDTPGWAVGWYFIPVACVWKPFVAMRDIVRASTLREGPPEFLVPMWWTLWISVWSMVIAKDANVGQASGIHGLLGVATRCLVIPLFFTAVTLVRTITALQSTTAAALAEALPADPASPQS